MRVLVGSLHFTIRMSMTSELESWGHGVGPYSSRRGDTDLLFKMSRSMSSSDIHGLMDCESQFQQASNLISRWSTEKIGSGKSNRESWIERYSKLDRKKPYGQTEQLSPATSHIRIIQIPPLCLLGPLFSLPIISIQYRSPTPECPLGRAHDPPIRA
jgi:hypothetical protein